MSPSTVQPVRFCSRDCTFHQTTPLAQTGPSSTSTTSPGWINPRIAPVLQLGSALTRFAYGGYKLTYAEIPISSRVVGDPGQMNGVALGVTVSVAVGLGVRLTVGDGVAVSVLVAVGVASSPETVPPEDGCSESVVMRGEHAAASSIKNSIGMNCGDRRVPSRFISVTWQSYRRLHYRTNFSRCGSGTCGQGIQLLRHLSCSAIARH
jgi:hypothetical protein